MKYVQIYSGFIFFTFYASKMGTTHLNNKVNLNIKIYSPLKVFTICHSVSVVFCFVSIFQTCIVVVAIAATYFTYTDVHLYVSRVCKCDNSTANGLSARPPENIFMNSSLNASEIGTEGFHMKKRIQTGLPDAFKRTVKEYSAEKQNPTVDMPSEYFLKYFPQLKSDRMMIYSCVNRLCGGWGDRIRGLYSVYILSVFQNRTFAVEIMKPCDIGEFLRPNILDWRLPSNTLDGKNVSVVSLIDRGAPPLTVEDILANVPDTDIVRVTFNMDFINVFRFHERGKEKLAFLKHLFNSDIHKIIYHGLFKLTDSLEEELNQFFGNKVGDHKLISAHIRVGDEGGRIRLKEEDLDKIWDFLMQYRNKSTCKLFIASDRQYVKDNAQNLFGDQYVGFTEKIIHIDHVRYRNDTACQGHRLSILEYSVLARSDTLLVTSSGFGIEAAYLRSTPDNLYCYLVNEGTIACRPESLKALYNR